MEDFKLERWATGKVAVQAIKDEWHVRLARYRTKNGPGDWHVTVGNLEHQNCLSVAKPSRIQLVASSVVRGALSADPTTSARSLVAQLRHQAKVTASHHVMYRAKDALTTELFSEDPTTIRFLPSLLSEFQRLNAGTFTELQCDTQGRFRRAIVVLSPRWFSQCQAIYGVDAAHMKHRKYNGIQIVLVGRDGNLTNKIAAVALAPLEDYDNYAWFFGHVLQHGFPFTTSSVFSDRNVGLVAVADKLNISNMFCVRHIIGNMRADKTVRLSVTQAKFVWEANAATTRSEFDDAIAKLNAVNSAAVAYLNAIPPEKWALHPHFDSTPLFGWRTTNFVESEQSKSLRLKPRTMQPYEFFKSYTTILMGECYNRVKLSTMWEKADRAVTPRAERKFQAQLADAAEYVVTFSTDNVAFACRISSQLKQRRVDTKNATCSCSTWKQHRIPCRHLIATLLASNMADTAYELIGECYTVAAYRESVGTLEIPEDRLLAADPSILPASYIRQAGRPKKRRITSQGEVGGNARKPYKCTRCGAMGHNKATCRFTSA